MRHNFAYVTLILKREGSSFRTLDAAFGPSSGPRAFPEHVKGRGDGQVSFDIGLSNLVCCLHPVSHPTLASLHPKSWDFFYRCEAADYSLGPLGINTTIIPYPTGGATYVPVKEETICQPIDVPAGGLTVTQLGAFSQMRYDGLTHTGLNYILSVHGSSNNLLGQVAGVWTQGIGNVVCNLHLVECSDNCRRCLALCLNFSLLEAVLTAPI